jgi:hypothetical protein
LLNQNHQEHLRMQKENCSVQWIAYSITYCVEKNEKPIPRKRIFQILQTP